MDFINQFLQDPLFGFKYLNPDYLFGEGSGFVQTVYRAVWKGETLAIFNLILSVLAIFFILVISYCVIRMFEIRRKEHKHLQHEIAEYAHHQAEKNKVTEENVTKNERWRSALTHLLSNNVNDWRLAIIEADTMLESLTEQLGFKGETLGERLKSVDKDKFRGLNLAWEAHAMRNRIAHEGLEFQFSHNEAKRIIALYEQIFRDYDYI